MKRKLLLRTLAFCVTSTLLVGSSMAQSSSSGQSDPSGSSSSSSSQSLSPTSSQSSSQKPERLSQLMGATVKDQQGNTLGQVNDFIVSPASGRIQFAVISLSDQTGKLTAVPWPLLKPGTDPSTFTLNVDKQKLASAQTFDTTSWPDFSQPSTAQQIYSFYGIQGRGMGGRMPMGGSEGGSSGSSSGGTSGSSGGADQSSTNNPGGH